MAMKSVNPFPINQYLGPYYFCDREEETSRLISNLVNGNSTTLIAHRRIGKTGLIHHVFHKLPKGWQGIYIDIQETENLFDFLNLLATGLARAIPQKTRTGTRFWGFLASLRPVFSFDGLSGQPQVSFDIKSTDPQKDLESILKVLDGLGEKFVIAIDEFQQIIQYPETNTDTWLRSKMQQLHNVFFIFSGSQQHLMTELFSSPDRPFYRSTLFMKLDKLPGDVYAKFIRKKFQENKKSIDLPVIKEMLEWTNHHTFYVQQLCNRVFAQTTDVATPELWRQVAGSILAEQEIVFFTIRNLLTKHQWRLLKAIAADHKVYQPTAGNFISRNELGSSAAVLRSLNVLITNELVMHDFDKDGNSFYAVYDVYLQRWVEMNRL